MILCPLCEHEILPYLKTGELKEIEEENMVSYQLYWCIDCRIVFYKKHEEFKIKNLIEEQAKKGAKDEITRKAKSGINRHSG